MSINKNKRKHAPETGICSLLGTEGVYAKSHLIPLALTSPGEKGVKLIEAGRGKRPIRRPTGWYDYKLCTHEGEIILRDIDTKGIEALRKHKLIWGSWKLKSQQYLGDDLLYPPGATPVNFREISLERVEADDLKLLYLSILWRFMKSTRPEFSYLEDIGIDLDEIRDHIVSKTVPEKEHYAICLHQHITKGMPHNHSPTIQKMEFNVNGTKTVVQFYRIYFDGLIAHIYKRNEILIELAAGDTDTSTFLGYKDKLIVFARAFEDSRQLDELSREVNDVTELWPAESKRVGV